MQKKTDQNCLCTNRLAPAQVAQACCVCDFGFKGD